MSGSCHTYKFGDIKIDHVSFLDPHIKLMHTLYYAKTEGVEIIPQFSFGKTGNGAFLSDALYSWLYKNGEP